MEELMWVENYILWKSVLRKVTYKNEVIIYVIRVPFWKSWRTGFRELKRGDGRGKLLLHQYIERGV